MKHFDEIKSPFQMKKSANDTSLINLNRKMQLIYDVLDNGDEVTKAAESETNGEANTS